MQEIYIDDWLDSMSAVYIFHHYDEILQTLEACDQDTLLDDLIERIEYHESGPVLPEYFFTLLLRYSKQFALELTEAICNNIENMAGQHFVNSFETFRITAYENDNFTANDDELECAGYENKEDVLTTIIQCLISIQLSIVMSRVSSDTWHQEDSIKESGRIDKLLHECQVLYKKTYKNNEQDFNLYVPARMVYPQYRELPNQLNNRDPERISQSL